MNVSFVAVFFFCFTMVISASEILLKLTLTAPTSNSTGYVFTSTGLPNGEAAPRKILGHDSKMCHELPSSSMRQMVNLRVEELRSSGQASPTSLLLGRFKFSNPFSANSPEVEYPALIDTGAAFSILPGILMQELSMPLGDECSVQWGGKE